MTRYIGDMACILPVDDRDEALETVSDGDEEQTGPECSNNPKIPEYSLLVAAKMVKHYLNCQIQIQDISDYH